MLQLVQQITEFLEPAIPFLMIGGKKAAEKAGEKMGSDGWEKAKSIWERLCSGEKEDLEEIARDLAYEPEDMETKQALKKEIERLIEKEPNLAEEITSLIHNSVVHKVLAEQNSSIKKVRQHTTGGNNVCVEVIARNNSNIEDVEQTHNGK